MSGGVCYQQKPCKVYISLKFQSFSCQYMCLRWCHLGNLANTLCIFDNTVPMFMHTCLGYLVENQQ